MALFPHQQAFLGHTGASVHTFETPQMVSWPPPQPPAGMYPPPQTSGFAGFTAYPSAGGMPGGFIVAAQPQPSVSHTTGMAPSDFGYIQVSAIQQQQFQQHQQQHQAFMMQHQQQQQQQLLMQQQQQHQQQQQQQRLQQANPPSLIGASPLQWPLMHTPGAVAPAPASTPALALPPVMAALSNNSSSSSSEQGTAAAAVAAVVASANSPRIVASSEKVSVAPVRSSASSTASSAASIGGPLGAFQRTASDRPMASPPATTASTSPATITAATLFGDVGATFTDDVDEDDTDDSSHDGTTEDGQRKRPRKAHMMTDRQRRAKIKGGMDALKQILAQQGMHVSDQVSIMMSTVTLLQTLRNEMAELHRALDLASTDLEGVRGMIAPTHPALAGVVAQRLQHINTTRQHALHSAQIRQGFPHTTLLGKRTSTTATAPSPATSPAPAATPAAASAATITAQTTAVTVAPAAIAIATPAPISTISAIALPTASPTSPISHVSTPCTPSSSSSNASSPKSSRTTDKVAIPSLVPPLRSEETTTTDAKTATPPPTQPTEATAATTQPSAATPAPQT